MLANKNLGHKHLLLKVWHKITAQHMLHMSQSFRCGGAGV